MGTPSNTRPNLIERLEELAFSLDEARAFCESKDDADSHSACRSIDNAYGIAGEVLTMIDGR